MVVVGDSILFIQSIDTHSIYVFTIQATSAQSNLFARNNRIINWFVWFSQQLMASINGAN